MKKFILKSIFIFLPILLGAICMELLLRYLPNDYKYKNSYLNAHSSEIETLILGSSHSYFDLNPRYFSSMTFNAGEVSQTLNFDFEIFKKYQNKFRNLKTIILPISYFSLFEKLEEGKDSWRVHYYVIYYSLNTSQSWTDFTEIFSNQFIVNLKRLASFCIKGNSDLLCDKLGWGTSYKSENAQNLLETGKAAAIRHSSDIKLERCQLDYKNNLSILYTIAKWCQTNNVKLILFTPPAFESYRENLNSEQLSITVKTANSIASKCNNCEYYDFLSDTAFIAKDFYDADHLSDIGAKKLSKIINIKIIEGK